VEINVRYENLLNNQTTSFPSGCLINNLPWKLAELRVTNWLRGWHKKPSILKTLWESKDSHNLSPFFFGSSYILYNLFFYEKVIIIHVTISGVPMNYLSCTVVYMVILWRRKCKTREFLWNFVNISPLLICKACYLDQFRCFNDTQVDFSVECFLNCFQFLPLIGVVIRLWYAYILNQTQNLFILD
jgi:hypothetical protein